MRYRNWALVAILVVGVPLSGLWLFSVVTCYFLLEARTDTAPLVPLGLDDCLLVHQTIQLLGDHVGGLAHDTGWTSDFATVENLYDQYRRSEVHPGHDYVIERRTRVARANKFHSKPRGSPTGEALAEATHYAAAATEDPAVPDRNAAAFDRIAERAHPGGPSDRGYHQGQHRRLQKRCCRL